VSDLTADLLDAVNAGALMLATAPRSLNIWPPSGSSTTGAALIAQTSPSLQTRDVPLCGEPELPDGYFIYRLRCVCQPAGCRWRRASCGGRQGAVAALMPAG